MCVCARIVSDMCVDVEDVRRMNLRWGEGEGYSMYCRALKGLKEELEEYTDNIRLISG